MHLFEVRTTNQLRYKMDSETDTCHICQAEFTEETTPGEFCYTCERCNEHVCTSCSENDPRDSMRVICDDCWTDADDAAFAEESSPSNARAVTPGEKGTANE